MLNKYNIISIALVAATIVTFLAAFVLSTQYIGKRGAVLNATQTHKVGFIANKRLKIPKEYFMYSHLADFSEGDVLLAVSYPEFTPLEFDHQTLWNMGKWDEKVVILLSNPVGKQTIKDSFQSLSRMFRATRLAEGPWGLKLFTQEVGKENDLDDIFVDDVMAPRVYINCSKVISANSNPQCSLVTTDDNFHFNLSFDKDLLPHWKDIEARSKALSNSFIIKYEAAILPGED